MMRGEQAQSLPAGGEVGDLVTMLLVEYLDERTPEGTLSEVLRIAAERMQLHLAANPNVWPAYAQRRSVLEATGIVFGGPDTMIGVGRCVFDSVRHPERLEIFQNLGSIDALYEALPSLMELYGTAFTLETQMIGPNACRFETRMLEGNEPFPEVCNFAFGLVSTLPQLFGGSVADIEIESCQCDGAPSCVAVLRWEQNDAEEARTGRAEMRVRLLEARLLELEQTVAELGSGDGLPVVLARVMEGAMRAVQAPSFILDIKASPTADRFTRTRCIEEGSASVVTSRLRETGVSGVMDGMLVSRIASERGNYGHLVAIREGHTTFEARELEVLDSYARLAASALDAEASVVEARRQATTAQALLALSTALADLGTSEEVVQHLAQAVPSVIDCDRVLISLDDADGSVTRVRATFGFDAAMEEELSLRAQPIPDDIDPNEIFWHGEPLFPSSVGAALVESGSVRSCSFAITSNAERFGWITVSVTNRPDRMDDPMMMERLQGLAGQAAVAIHNARLIEAIRYQALHDSLTGLPNRVLIRDRVDQAMARARRDHNDVALLFVDLDGFKDVNDNLGHKLGDDLLCAVAARFASTLRESDTVARLGGDEFVVLAEGISLAAGPELVAERLLNILAEPFVLGERNQIQVSVSASIGIAAGLRESSDELFRDADVALYSAKEAGKNRHVLFVSEMYDVMHSRHELEMDLQAAIGTDQFQLDYQPIFNLSDMTVVGVEALLRWRHPTRGLMQPDDFIPPLEASGAIIPVGRWVLDEACRQAMSWRKRGHDITMSINASARQLDADTLLDDVCHALSGSGLPARNLIIEITETSIMSDSKQALAQLNALKALGVRIAIDDFGTGYSSLAYLQRFPVDTLKIDRSFIAAMGKSPEGDTLIHTLIQLGKALNLETLAEGIEDAEQLDQLRLEQCDVGQGYLFARPLSPEALERYFDPATSPVCV